MNYQKPKCYAVKHKDENTRTESRSGGIFSALSDKVLDDGGVIYGCVLTDDFKAIHIRAEHTETRNLMRGSKYIQSRLDDSFQKVKCDLLAGREVLFSGTSCQIAGLKNFLGNEYENLFCVDIVCHGVPSVKVWEAYLKWQEKRNKAKVIEADFRNKKEFGWHDHVETLTMDNGKKVNSRVFRNLFYDHNILRPCCYECPYKKIIHPGNITIADYWGIENAAPEYDDNKGVSLVLINDEKGKSLFDSVKVRIQYKETRIEDSMQPPLMAPFSKPECREQFWIDFYNKSFQYIAKNYAGVGFVNKIKRKAIMIKQKMKLKVGD